MPAVKEPPGRYEMRKALRIMREYGVGEFDLQQLESLNIRFEPMILDEASSHKPLYFAPYPGDWVPDPDEEALEDSYKGIDEEGPDFPFIGPSDRAYGMNIYLTRYISHCKMESKGEDVLWRRRKYATLPIPLGCFAPNLCLVAETIRLQDCTSFKSPGLGWVLSYKRYA